MRQVGETSMETRPSTWFDASQTGRNTSRAAATSWVVAAKTASSAVAPEAASSVT